MNESGTGTEPTMPGAKADGKGVHLYRTDSTPFPGAWVVTDLGVALEGMYGDDVAVAGYDLGWSATGLEGGYAHCGTFEELAGLVAAVAAMEAVPDGTAEDARSALDAAGYAVVPPVGLQAGSPPYAKSLGNGLVGILTFDMMEVGAVTVSADGSGRRRLATVVDQRLAAAKSCRQGRLAVAAALAAIDASLGAVGGR